MNIRNSESLTCFKSKVLKFIHPSVNSIYLCNNPKGIQLLTRLRLRLSHLEDHTFKHNFQDTLNRICNCSEDIETLCHYLFHCSLYTNDRLAPLNVIQGIDNSILKLTDSHIVEVLLYHSLEPPPPPPFLFFFKLLKNFVVPFNGGGSTASRLEPLRGGS